MRFKANIMMRTMFLAIFSFGVVAQTPVAEHWSPYEYPKEIAEGVQFHIVVDGDTLWGIASAYFQDPFLWPQIYQANPYIQDPDLIYPGDPVVLDIGVVVTDQTIADNLGDSLGEEGQDGGELAELSEFAEGDDGAQVSDRSQTTSMVGSGGELVIIPAGDRVDLECSTYLFPVTDDDYELPFTMTVVGSELAGQLSFATDDIVYINKGNVDGVQAGDEFSIRREQGLVRRPHGDKEILGVAIDQVGRLRVIAVQEKGSTALITFSCDRVLQGDILVPYEQEPIPLITQLPPFDRWEPFNKDDSGHIVFSEDRRINIGKGSLTNIDLGVLDNVAPGDIFIIYRPNHGNDAKKGIELPDIYLGQGVALKSSEKSSVMKVIQGVDVIRVGDRVVLYQN